MSIALVADLAIATDDTVFNLAYINIANNPDCGGSWALTQAVGLRKAMEIALLADNIDAAEALRLGLVSRVIPKDQFEEKSFEFVRLLAESAPLALASTKRLLRESMLRTLPQQLDSEKAAFIVNTSSGDFREALRAFFEKRKPIFSGN
jgi:2-(1,2-epoxy-1,2-dihydrophenyl)acetyl-CoA isomerase